LQLASATGARDAQAAADKKKQIQGFFGKFNTATGITKEEQEKNDRIALGIEDVPKFDEPKEEENNQFGTITLGA